MGRKKKIGLGKSIIKDQRASRRPDKSTDSWRHTSELNDGYDWGRLNLQSVTEQSALDDFLATAELAGTEFTAEKANVIFVGSATNEAIMTADDIAAIKTAQDQNKELLRIPRRPMWDENTSADELNLRERDSFLEWRKNLAKLQEKKHLILTPFETNLEVWRQLWRVIERSDVVVQIVDARNPLLFYCPDLELYVKEVDPMKSTLVLINKADLLTSKQRLMWSEYFKNQGSQVVFWSAIAETERYERENAVYEDEETQEDEQDSDSDGNEENKTHKPTYEQLSFLIDEDDLAENIEKLQFSQENNENNATSVASTQESTSNEHKIADKSEHTVEENTCSSAQTKCCVESSLISQTSEETLPSVQEATKNVQSLPMKIESSSEETENISTQTENECCDSQVESSLNVEKLTSNIDTNKNSLDNEPRNVQDMLNAFVPCDKTTEENSELSSSVVPSEEIGTEDKMFCDSEKFSVQTGEVFCHDGLLTGEKLLDVFQMLHQTLTGKNDDEFKQVKTTVGLVGYPNVGKSSTINAILQGKKVTVSATPGKTKHFQTLLVDDSLCLCDCPGLVFPSFVSTKAEMVINGILPIDQMRDHIPPMTLVCQYINRNVLESIYGFNVPPPGEGEDPNRPPTADEVLNAYGYMRGYMTAHGLPDGPRSSRYLLKDYVKGKLLYCQPPPGADIDEFQEGHYTSSVLAYQDVEHMEKRKKQTQTSKKQPLSSVDREFFKQENVEVFAKGAHGATKLSIDGVMVDLSDPQQRALYKPWKKHHNKNKKEKLRRIHKD